MVLVRSALFDEIQGTQAGSCFEGGGLCMCGMHGFSAYLLPNVSSSHVICDVESLFVSQAGVVIA